MTSLVVTIVLFFGNNTFGLVPRKTTRKVARDFHAGHRLDDSNTSHAKLMHDFHGL